ncbi:MAG: hypothetical protein HC866_17840 [Leptolyngbyaceae cyanobacterium RU_5_1]|nr:hypothetical protein [Leptolyngbyaceae cyanobacterium RU_5_1]
MPSSEFDGASSLLLPYRFSPFTDGDRSFIQLPAITYKITNEKAIAR